MINRKSLVLTSAIAIIGLTFSTAQKKALAENKLENVKIYIEESSSHPTESHKCIGRVDVDGEEVVSGEWNKNKPCEDYESNSGYANMVLIRHGHYNFIFYFLLDKLGNKTS